MLAWRKAVIELLDYAGTAESKLAEAVGVSRPQSWQYLHGKRNPSPRRVKDYNRELARLLGDPNVAHYLDSLWSANEPQTDEEALARAVKGTVAALTVIGGKYLREGAAQEILDRVILLSVNRQIKLFHEVNEIWRRSVLRNLRAHRERKTPYSQIVERFRADGIEIAHWHRGSIARYHVEEAAEIFEMAVRKTLVDAIDDRARRLVAIREILNAFGWIRDAWIPVILEATDRSQASSRRRGG